MRMTILYGQRKTCARIAGIIARERGLQKVFVQAAGVAAAHNSISRILPSYRAVGSSGALDGYDQDQGVERRRA